MSTVESTMEIDRPVSEVYDRWTRFEEFPAFMEGVEEIRQLDDTTLEWHVSIAGVDRRFRTEIVEQEPDTRIAWRTEDGEDHTGAVTFDQTRDGNTRVKVVMSYRPENWVEKVADATNIIEGRVNGDLKRFKELAEDRAQDPDGWRGNVAGGQVTEGDDVVGGNR